jgi:hypothetical protein
MAKTPRFPVGRGRIQQHRLHQISLSRRCGRIIVHLFDRLEGEVAPMEELGGAVAFLDDNAFIPASDQFTDRGGSVSEGVTAGAGLAQEQAQAKTEDYGKTPHSLKLPILGRKFKAIPIPRFRRPNH